jgi:Fe2+ transport system protein FeoA
MTLDTISDEKKLKIIKIEAGQTVKQRLTSMGIREGDLIIKYKGNWGPVLVKNISMNSSKIAIGRGEAKKIFVEYSEP